VWEAIAVLRDQINGALREAMKARDARRVSTLRLVLAAIKNAEIEAQMHGKPAPAEDEMLTILQKMIKQRQEALEVYRQAGRNELAEQERGEIDIIQGYLPSPMSEDEAKAAIAQAIQSTAAHGMKDMGKVMAALKQRHAGRMDFGKVSRLVKEMLAG
jgi:uncharacterized protein YqeY